MLEYQMLASWIHSMPQNVDGAKSIEWKDY